MTRTEVLSLLERLTHCGGDSQLTVAQALSRAYGAGYKAAELFRSTYKEQERKEDPCPK